VVAAAIVLAALAAYSSAFGASFHFDDLSSIVDNPQIRELGRLWPPSGTRWLGYVSFALNYRLGGLSVVGYHVANVAIHAVNALLVAWLAALTLRTPAVRGRTSEAIRGWLPLAAGVLFVVHPLATQAVTYVVQRLTSLATLFYLLSVAAYVAARLRLADGRSRGRAVALYALSLASALAAMKTKEIASPRPATTSSSSRAGAPGSSSCRSPPPPSSSR
jgi:hypothetical protein